MHADILKSWQTIGDAERALADALMAYADALYTHNVNDRGIAPLAAYRDASTTLQTTTERLAQDARTHVQMRVVKRAA